MMVSQIVRGHRNSARTVCAGASNDSIKLQFEFMLIRLPPPFLRQHPVFCWGFLEWVTAFFMFIRSLSRQRRPVVS